MLARPNFCFPMPASFSSARSFFMSAAPVLGTLVAASLAAWLFESLHVPLPWMLGPLMGTALLSILGAPVRSWLPARNAGQWLLGSTLGLYFTPVVCAALLQLSWAIVLAVVWALLLGGLAGWVLLRTQQGRIAGLDWRTTYLAGCVGAASEMTLIAERAGARTDLVASAHSLRMLLVTIILPLAMLWGGFAGSAPVAQVPALPAGLWWMLALTLVGGAVLRHLRMTNPWFLGALFVAMVLAAFEVAPTPLPRWLVNTAQLLIGISLGVRFTRAFLRMAPSWMGTVALMTLSMILASAGFAVLLAWMSGQPVATMVLATSPGGIGEMAITAKVMGLGAPVVTAFQVCRLAVVLTMTLPILRLLERWIGKPKAQAA
jgi:membrane AbrB-like protein